MMVNNINNTKALYDIVEHNYNLYRTSCRTFRRLWKDRFCNNLEGKLRQAMVLETRLELKVHLNLLRNYKLCYKSLAKQLPKLLVLTMKNGCNDIMSFSSYSCPVCKTTLSYGRKQPRFKYCPICGQRLKW